MSGAVRNASGKARQGTTGAARILSLEKIWDRAEHSAFTDLIRLRGKWYCAFREASSHVEGDGRVRIIESADGRSWKPAAIIAEQGVDLRDPKLCTTPDGRLMLLMGGTARGECGSPGRRPRVSFQGKDRRWSRPLAILADGDWLWRVTWHQGRAYGVSYTIRNAERWDITLVSSGDGVDYREVCRLAVPGKPNETTLRFLSDGSAMALVRREGGDRQAWIGTSPPPYAKWKWHPAGQRIGGPNFIVLPDGSMWAAGRAYTGDGYRTVIAAIGPREYRPVLELPSEGDCSYPGLAWHGGLLWVSYYSSHEGRASVYLARVRLPTPSFFSPLPSPRRTRSWRRPRL